MKDFGSLAEFGAHLLLAEVAAHKALEKGLDKAAAHIERAAKGKIGEYQDANGMHEAWPELADSTKEDRVRKGFTENDPLLRTGELRDSLSHETHGLEAAIGSTSDIAVYQELGTDKIPPRPFLGAAAYESVDEVKKTGRRRGDYRDRRGKFAGLQGLEEAAEYEVKHKGSRSHRYGSSAKKEQAEHSDDDPLRKGQQRGLFMARWDLPDVWVLDPGNTVGQPFLSTNEKFHDR